MPYCRTCGNKIESNDRFCQRCGKPIWNFSPPPPTKQTPRIHRDPIIVGGIVLAIVLLVAVVAIVLLAVPLSTWGFNKSLEDNSANVKTLNLNFESNIGQIKITPLKIDNNNIGIYIKANGSRRITEELGNPVTILFDNRTEGETLNVNSKVLIENNYLIEANVVIDIFIDPVLNANLNITTDAGSINLAADRHLLVKSLNLQTMAGSVDVTLYNATISGNVSLMTNAGSVYFGMSQINTVGNNTVNLHSNAGSVTVDIAQTKAMQGDLSVTAETSLGSVNILLEVDGDVAAKIASITSLGVINLQTAHKFSGNQSLIQSNNYPAASNIEINSRTNLGSINIEANYQSKTQPNINRN